MALLGAPLNGSIKKEGFTSVFHGSFSARLGVSELDSRFLWMSAMSVQNLDKLFQPRSIAPTALSLGLNRRFLADRGR